MDMTIIRGNISRVQKSKRGTLCSSENLKLQLESFLKECNKTSMFLFLNYYFQAWSTIFTYHILYNLPLDCIENTFFSSVPTFLIPPTRLFVEYFHYMQIVKRFFTFKASKIKTLKGKYKSLPIKRENCKIFNLAWFLWAKFMQH